MHTVIIVIHVIVTILLIGIILIQRSGDDGMGGLGGGSGSNLLSGRASANFLTRTTAILATIFILTSLALSIVQQQSGGGSILDQVGGEPAASAPVEPASPAPAEQNQAPVVPKPE